MAKSEIKRIRSAHATVAKLVVSDAVYLPIFERLEAELAKAEAATMADPVAVARALSVSRQMAMS